MKIKDAFPKIISSFFSLTVLTLFSIGCSDSSTENGPTGDVYEDRLLYINALDHKLYTCDINGVPSYEGEMLDDLDYLKFSHSSFNIARKKIVYYSADSGKVFIRNFDGSGRIAVNVDLSRSKDFDLQWMPDNEHVLCSINGKFFKFDFEGKNLILLNEFPDTMVYTGYCRSYNFHFSSGGKFIVEFPRLTLVCNADASIYREYASRDDKSKFVPIVSFSGSELYYLSFNSVNQLGMTVYSRNLESGADRQITHDSVSVLNYMPSSDDNYIAIGTNYHETYLYNLQTGVLTLLSASSSGSDFGFTSALDKVFWRSMQGSIISANIDGTNERVLIPDVYLFFGAAKVKK